MTSNTRSWKLIKKKLTVTFFGVNHPYLHYLYLHPIHGLNFWGPGSAPEHPVLYGGGLVAQSCPTLCNPIVCSLPGSSVHGIFFRQEYWSELPFPFPGGSSQPRDQTHDSCITGRFCNYWATNEAHPVLWPCLKTKQNKQNKKGREERKDFNAVAW